MSDPGVYRLNPEVERKNAHPVPFLSSRERARLGQAVMDATGCGPYHGGCLALATAMSRLVGGQVVTLRSDVGAEHAVLDFHGMIVDFEGGGTARNMLMNFRAAQMLDADARLVSSVGPRTGGDFPNAPYSEEMVHAIMGSLPEDLSERLERVAREVGFQTGTQAPRARPFAALVDRFRGRPPSAPASTARMANKSP